MSNTSDGFETLDAIYGEAMLGVRVRRATLLKRFTEIPNGLYSCQFVEDSGQAVHAAEDIFFWDGQV